MGAMKIIAASILYTSGRPPLEGGAVVVRDGRIAAVGSLDDVRSEFPLPVEGYPGCVIMPGMVNAHTHLELTHFPAWKLRKGLDYAPRTYVDWIIQVIKLRRGLDRSELEHSVREGARISLESGTTTIGEIVTDLSLLPLYRQLGVSGRVYCEAIGQSAQQSMERRTAIVVALTSFSGESLSPGISPHAPHTLSGEFLGDLVALAEQRSLPLMIHLAESAEEVEFCFDSSGKIAEQLYPFVGWESYLPAPHRVSPVGLLQAAGGLTPLTSAVHCVHV
ncbi:MAG: amidohydrolase family protein, partial [Geobacter sp.]|nr:amidohydrolase family protein [Geobacter sp.]